MDKFLKLSAAWALYWIGHFISRGPMSWTDSERLHSFLYPAYNWCMGHSSELDKWDVIWKPANG